MHGLTFSHSMCSAYALGRQCPQAFLGVQCSLWVRVYSQVLSDLPCVVHLTLHTQVAAMAGVMDTDPTNRKATSEIEIGPLLTASYASLVEVELKRRLKQAPVAFYTRPPTKLFTEDAAVDLLGWDLS